MNKMRTGLIHGVSKPIMRILMVVSILCAFQSLARAHEVMPAIADFSVENGQLRLNFSAPVEGFISGIDLTDVKDTNASPLAQDYDKLRALPPDELIQQFRTFWPEMAKLIRIEADKALIEPVLAEIKVDEVGDTAVARPASFIITANLPTDARELSFGWDKKFGALVLRQQGVEKPFTGLLEAGANSGPISLSGGGEVSAWRAFLDYIPVGFDHIVPKGLDHILFVLGLFFLSTKVKPLLWQVTAFTIAHTITLILSSLGIIKLPSNIVEPLIAASIVFVALENIWVKGALSRWRPVIVFGFGLLHGLGFASVLGDFGLPEGNFLPALLGFNLGVEFGQLSVIAVAALLLWTWAARKEWYRKFVSIPASLLIAAVGAFWVIERTVL